MTHKRKERYEAIDWFVLHRNCPKLYSLFFISVEKPEQ